MAVELTVNFYGLHAVVPNTDGSKSARVLLPDARGRRRASDGVILQPHVAAIEYDATQWVLEQVTEPGMPPTLVPDVDIQLNRQGYLGGQQTRLLLLGQEDLRFNCAPDGNQPFKFVNPTQQPYLKLEDCVAGAGAIAPDCLGDPPPPSLVARWAFANGTLEPEPIGARQEYFLDALVNDHVPPRDVTPANGQMAETSVWSLLCDDQKEIALEARLPGDNNIAWRLVSQSKAAAPLVVWNSEWTRIRYPFNATPEGVPDRDFEVYYSLSKTPVTFKIVPTVSDGGGGGGAAKCMCTCFSPDARA